MILEVLDAKGQRWSVPVALGQEPLGAVEEFMRFWGAEEESFPIVLFVDSSPIYLVEEDGTVKLASVAQRFEEKEGRRG